MKLTRSNSSTVDEGEDHEHGTDGPAESLGILLEGETTSGEHEAEEDDLTVEVDSPSTELLQHDPSDDSAAESHGVSADGEVERLVGGKTSLEIEIRGETHDGTTAPNLDHVDHGSNLGTTTIGALEAFPVATTSSGGGLFELVSVDHHLDGLLSLVIRDTTFGSEATDDMLGFVKTTLTNEPPGRLGSQEAADGDGNWPDPLNGEWDLVSPMRIDVDRGAHDARGDNLTKNPATVDPSGEDGTQTGWGDVGGVGGGDGLEDTPRQTLEDLTDKEDGERRGIEGDKDECGDGSKGAEDGLAVTKALRSPTSELKTNQTTDESCVLQAGLPSGRDLTCAVGLAFAVPLCESRLSEKVTEQNDIVSIRVASKRSSGE